jgi:hypothetical protein
VQYIHASHSKVPVGIALNTAAVLSDRITEARAMKPTMTDAPRNCADDQTLNASRVPSSQIRGNVKLTMVTILSLLSVALCSCDP